MGFYIDVFDIEIYNEMFPIISELGFDGFFSGHHLANDFNNLQKYNLLAKEYNLSQETSHSTIPYCECLWLDGEPGEKYTEVLINNIKNCKLLNIPTLIVHVQTSGNPQLQTGLNRLAKAVAYAKECDVKLAFENINEPSFLYAVLDRFRDINVGFCYDCGHEACYSLGENYLEKIGDRLLCTHLHDNDLQNDNHFIPFDGKIDFSLVTKQLKNCNYKGNLTLELSYNNASDGLEYKDFFKKCLSVENKLKEMIY